MKKLLILLVALFTINANASDTHRIRLATTTSTYHSGLLDYLLPKFESDTGIKVDVIAAGTGKALRMGQNGDVDLVMTHAPKAEADFVNKGYGISPKKLMYNDFVVVGPKNDPAQLNQSTSIEDAFTRLSNHKSIFVSRGDDSGTNKKELNLWAKTGVEPTFSGYRAVGQGMGPTLNMASELQGYTLSDRGTWLAYFARLDLEIVYQNDPELFNPYQVILINPKRFPTLNTADAKIFSDWLVAAKGQQLINDFKLNGKQLFVANADTTITTDN
ncbi:substrate-binding domain-containing protein [Vibrio gallicus]|uniref:substrate-binding domain-containing protein n=1 Tax=Vibrio gallicus TaxID=190897 RepID=UPI0021C27530|nr:substrate-binding domain-containing protein [Vibrio gallicus]